MSKPWWIVATLVAMLGSAEGNEPSMNPAPFKIQIAAFALRKEPVATEEIVFRQGKAYVFPADSREVIIIEPGRGLVEILDVGRRVQSEILFRSLDDSLDKIKTKLRETSEKREKEGGRANLIEAKMTRDLFETKLAIAPDPNKTRVRLTNPVVEIVADGDPETDAPRLALVATTLSTICRLGAFRSPNDLPPFIELESITALTGDRKLRPTELSYRYQLAGPPQRFRRTYQLVPELTARDAEAISRVDRLREVAPMVRYERYRMAR